MMRHFMTDKPKRFIRQHESSKTETNARIRFGFRRFVRPFLLACEKKQNDLISAPVLKVLGGVGTFFQEGSDLSRSLALN